MKKRILIPYASYGNGHKAIATYIKKYFEENGEYECMMIDLISYSIPFIGKINQKGSAFLMEKFPVLWTILFFSFDNKLSAYIAGNISTKLLDNRKLKKDIIAFNPDITISTYFLGTDIICEYNKKKLTNSKVVAVVTDYKSHDFWLRKLKSIDAIIVSSFEERIHLLRKGFKNGQIHTTGIPICPQNNNDVRRVELLKKFKINNDKKTVLFFGGGSNGTISTLIYFKEILKNNYDCNILFVAGKSKKLEKLAREYVARYNNKNVRVYGFVTNVNEFYQVSDLVVTKPGGAQVTECLYYEKPMLLIRGNGGIEIENRRFLVRKGYAKSVRSKNSFNKFFAEILENDELRNKMKESISNIEQHKAMEKLFQIIEKL